MQVPTNTTTDGEVVYLNHAGQAKFTDAVIKIGIESIQSEPWELNAATDQQRVRELFASLIDADAKEIAIMASTSYAITMAARNIQRLINEKSTKGRILILQDQYDSAIYPWEQICDESNGNLTLDIVPHPTADGATWTGDILNRINDNIVAACLPPMHWSDGALIDLEKISLACQKLDIPLVVDATQVVGIMPLSVKKIQPTFLACSVHKWLRSPAGASLVYVSEAAQKLWYPLDFHGRSRDLGGGSNWYATRNAMGPRGYPEKFVDDARKFDSGGKANPILLPMLRVALEGVAKLDLNKTQDTLKELMDPLLTWATDRGYCIAQYPRAYHLVGVRPPERTPEEMLEIADALLKKGIYVAVRCGGFRFSPYLDTPPSHIQILIDALNSLGL